LFIVYVKFVTQKRIEKQNLVALLANALFATNILSLCATIAVIYDKKNTIFIDVSFILF